MKHGVVLTVSVSAFASFFAVIFALFAVVLIHCFFVIVFSLRFGNLASYYMLVAECEMWGWGFCSNDSFSFLFGDAHLGVW